MNKLSIQQKIDDLTRERDSQMRLWEKLGKNRDTIFNRRKRELVRKRVNELNGQRAAWEAKLEYASDDSDFVQFVKRCWWLILIVGALAIYRIFFF